MKSNVNPTTFLIITACIVAATYWYFFTGKETEPSLTTSIEENEAQMQFQILVSQLRPISFDTSIFSEPRFMALIDLATPVASEPTGRLDPFAPIAGISGNE